MVGRLMPRSPGSRIPSGLPRLRGSHRHPRRLTQVPHPQKLGRSDDGRDHTVLPYARLACSPHYPPALSTLPEECWRDEPDSAAHLARSFGLTESNPPCPRLSRPNAAASTASPAREHDDHRSPLKDEPGWAMHTIFPNFGKVEYFCGEGLTGWRVFCPTGGSSWTIHGPAKNGISHH